MATLFDDDENGRIVFDDILNPGASLPDALSDNANDAIGFILRFCN
jgi:hypothetical protein